MHIKYLGPWLLALQLAGAPATHSEQIDDAALEPPPTLALVKTLEPPALAALAADVLERNPGLARARQRAAAAAVRAPQVKALPDPMASLTYFVLPPETRVGPQQLSVALTQRLPWFGKLPLREQAAVYAAAAAEAEVETTRLDLVTEARRLFYELAFHHRHEEIVRGERDTLVRYEEAARARYSAGTGMQQEIVRIQAQITRLDTRVLEISQRRAQLLAALNALRDRPAGEPVTGLALPAPGEPALDGEALRASARARPELAAADARIAEKKTLIEVAEKEFRPDFTVGLGFTRVGRREDPAGRAMPPPDDGDDILSFTGSVNLPVRRRKLEARLEEALAETRAAEEDRRRITADIERAIGDLGSRLPLLYEHWRLLEGVLQVQAREALRSAEAAYTTGKFNAVDLLDAEVVLFDVRTAAARTLTDYAVARAELERATTCPLPLSEGSTP